MKIGILTFHSQLNYGGVLQCWALQTALEKMGHEVVVLDLWRTPGNRALLGPFGSLSFKQWLKLIARSLLKGSQDFSAAVRHWRTIRFVHSRLHLTPFHFYEWKEVKSPLGVNCIVVGSDQVWHCGSWGDPRPFLLEGAPPVPAIAYAASFGIKTLPSHFPSDKSNLTAILSGPVFTRGLARFSAISCREKQGVAICEQLGFHAAHVCDPVFLTYRNLFGDKRSHHSPHRKRLMCYFLKEDISEMLDLFEAWARRTGWSIDVFGPGDIPWHRECRRRKTNKHVRLRVDAGPLQFVSAFRKVDACITDSFHAFALSLVFGLNVRVLRPNSPIQKEMGSRLAELAELASDDMVFSEDIADALTRIERGEQPTIRRPAIEAFRNASEAWLKTALERTR